MVTTEAFLLIIASILFIIEIVETAWCLSLNQRMAGHPGGKVTPIIAGTVFGITAAQGVLFLAVLALNLNADGSYPYRILAVILSQFVTATTMLWAITRVRHI